ncbi:hypothetical protein [Leptospirillum ferriphilum]|nr:hypothetical protein [Leptospirillum ferriphilum]
MNVRRDLETVLHSMFLPFRNLFQMAHRKMKKTAGIDWKDL